MKCYYCNREIPDDSLFCPECGARMEVQPDSSAFMGKTCPKCGARLKEEDRFCSRCGAMCYKHQRYSEPQQKKSKLWLLILIPVILILFILFAAAGFVAYKTLQSTLTEEVVEEKNVAEEADFNLYENNVLRLEGILRRTGSDEWVLQWDSELDFYGMDQNNGETFIDDAETAYIDTSENSDGALDMAGLNEKITISGTVYIFGNTLHIVPDKIYDGDGLELIGVYTSQLEQERLEEERKRQEEEALSKGEEGRKEEEEREKEEEKENEKTDGYILPDSDKVLLTRADTVNLSIQGINYAKNEIYARHGRKFRSKELQDYFDSKSWYQPTVEANDFSESVLSDIEKKNVEFLKKIEFEITPGGYQLDAE